MIPAKKFRVAIDEVLPRFDYIIELKINVFLPIDLDNTCYMFYELFIKNIEIEIIHVLIMLTVMSSLPLINAIAD